MQKYRATVREENQAFPGIPIDSRLFMMEAFQTKSWGISEKAHFLFRGEYNQRVLAMVLHMILTICTHTYLHGNRECRETKTIQHHDLD